MTTEQEKNIVKYNDRIKNRLNGYIVRYNAIVRDKISLDVVTPMGQFPLTKFTITFKGEDEQKIVFTGFGVEDRVRQYLIGLVDSVSSSGPRG